MPPMRRRGRRRASRRDASVPAAKTSRAVCSARLLARPKYAIEMIVDAIRRFLAEHDIRGPIVAAVSGGVDSTALLVALVEIGDIAFTAAHINHHLRGA